MTSSSNKSAYSAVKSVYADILMAELALESSGDAQILDFGAELPETDNISIISQKRDENTVAVLEEYPDQTFDGIILKSQLYLQENPLSFFEEALRLLKPGGRLVMLEPAISLASWAYYKYHSGCDVNMSVDPFAPSREASFQNTVRPNIAYPTVLFTRQEHRIQFMERFPSFHLVKRKWVGMIADPLSLGDKPYSLIPAAAVPLTFEIEDILNPFLGRWLSNKMLITLEKKT